MSGMTKTRFMRLALAVTVLLLIAAASAGFVWLYQEKQRLNAKATESWMLTNLSAVCESSAAQNLDKTLFECGRLGLTCTGKDGWGNALVIEVRNPPSARHRSCRVISLGRDHRRGPCCIGSTGEDWDADAVAEGGHWLQVWGGV